MSLLLFSGGGTPTDAIGSIDSGEVVDGPTFSSTVTVSIGSIDSGEVVDGPTFNQSFIVGSIASGEVVDGPRIFEPLSIGPRSIGSGEVVPGPNITQTGDPADPVYTPVISAGAYSRAGGALADLSGSERRSWRDPFNETGTGSLVLPNDDADLALFDYGDVIRFLIDGIARYAILVQTKTQVEIAATEEVAEETTVAGRGLLSIFEEAVVEPPLGVDRASFTDQRLFNFASPDLDDSSWGTPIVTYVNTTANDNSPLPDPVPVGFPADWPDETTQFIWDRDSGAGNVPAGTCYFRKEFTVADDVVAEVWAAADDAYEIWVDGVKLFEDAFDVGYLGQSKHARVMLDAGTHYIAARVVNLNNLKAGLWATVLELDQAGAPVGVITNSGSDWKILAYPSQAPGFTPGEVIRILVEEAQARGVLDEVLLAFSDLSDSNGDPWPITGDISFQVGIDLLSALLQIVETYCDVRMAIGSFTLSAWASTGSVTATELEQGVNLQALTHEGSV